MEEIKVFISPKTETQIIEHIRAMEKFRDSQSSNMNIYCSTSGRILLLKQLLDNAVIIPDLFLEEASLKSK
jgi:hypothetical protein